MPRNATLFLSLLLYLLATYYLGYLVKQSQFLGIAAGFAVAFLAYLQLMKIPLNVKHGIAIFLCSRMLLLFAFPNLSDDIYRFYWDAWVAAEGFSPYAEIPSKLIALGQMPKDAVFELMNSPNYYSVYPPFLQLIFKISYSIGGGLEGFSIVYKLLILCFELGTMYIVFGILDILQKPRYYFFFYGLNPLMVQEFSNNGHPEVFLIFGIALSLLLLLKLPRIWGLGWGIAIAAKINPLLWGPLFFAHSLKKWRTFIGLSTGVIGILTFIPMFYPVNYWENISSSLRLYYENFEFNPAIFAIVKEVGFILTGENQIEILGPAMSRWAAVGVIILAVFYKLLKFNTFQWLIRFMLWSWLLYIICSPTIHPWYISPIVFLSLFITRRYFLLWSAGIVLSYARYDAYWVDYLDYLAGLEYGLLLTAVILDVQDALSDFKLEKAWKK